MIIEWDVHKEFSQRKIMRSEPPGSFFFKEPYLSQEFVNLLCLTGNAHWAKQLLLT